MTNLEQLKKDALGYPDRAKRIIVHDNLTLIVANDFILDVKAMRKEVAGSYDPIISHAKAEKKKYDDPLKEAEGIARLHVTAYLDKLARIQREADERARAKEEARQKKETEALERAKKYKDQGMTEVADEIIEEIPLPEPIEEVPHLAVEGPILKQILDTEKINQFVATTEGKMAIPGIRIYPIWKWEITNRSLIPRSYYRSTMATKAPKEE